MKIVSLYIFLYVFFLKNIAKKNTNNDINKPLNNKKIKNNKPLNNKKIKNNKPLNNKNSNKKKQLSSIIIDSHLQNNQYIKNEFDKIKKQRKKDSSFLKSDDDKPQNDEYNTDEDIDISDFLYSLYQDIINFFIIKIKKKKKIIKKLNIKRIIICIMMGATIAYIIYKSQKTKNKTNNQQNSINESLHQKPININENKTSISKNFNGNSGISSLPTTNITSLIKEKIFENDTNKYLNYKPIAEEEKNTIINYINLFFKEDIQYINIKINKATQDNCFYNDLFYIKNDFILEENIENKLLLIRIIQSGLIETIKNPIKSKKDIKMICWNESDKAIELDNQLDKDQYDINIQFENEDIIIIKPKEKSYFKYKNNINYD